MIKIREYQTYWESIKSRIPAINSCYIVSHQDQIEGKIRQVVAGEIVMLVIVPSADTDALSIDCVRENNVCLIYLLKKISLPNSDDSIFVNEMEEVQDLTTSIKTMMLADQGEHKEPHFMHNFDPDKMHMDPEYNFFGCNGWSVSFTLATNGF